MEDRLFILIVHIRRAGMMEEAMEKKIDTETSYSGKKTFTEVLKKNAKELAALNCKGCS